MNDLTRSNPAARMAQSLASGARRVFDRLIARRGLLGLVAVILLLLVIASEFRFGMAVLGFAVAALVAASIEHADAGTQAGQNGSQHTPRGARAVDIGVLVNALPDAAIVLDRSGQVLFFNQAASDQFANLKRASHVSSVLRTPEFLDALARVRADGEPFTVAHAERVPVGRRIAVTIAPLGQDSRSEGGAAFLVHLRDLSEQERVDQMRADFVANASHELRTPLASLRGFIETLQGSARDDVVARERFLRIMASQAERMSRLIDDLLSLSRVEMNAHLPLTALVDVNEVVAHVADTMEPLARERGQTFAVHRAEGRLLVRGDRDELVQLFQNLTQNAVKYGRDGGRTDVRISRAPSRSGRGAMISVSIVDDGPGIAPEHIPRLTERFYRVDVASSREKGGTGLGLAIVKHVLNRHRGELEIQSRQGDGSTFTVLLTEAGG